MEDHCQKLNSSILPWDRFKAWVHCICVVTFDLELGQAMEVSCNKKLFKFYFLVIIFFIFKF